MSENKSIVTVAIACVGVLAVVCVALFWVAWSSLSTISQLREENHRLTLEMAICRMRLESATQARPMPVAPTQQSAAAPAPEAVQAAPSAAPTLKARTTQASQASQVAQTVRSAEVALAPEDTHEPKAKAALKKLLKKEPKKDPTPAQAAPEAAIKPVASAPTAFIKPAAAAPAPQVAPQSSTQPTQTAPQSAKEPAQTAGETSSQAMASEAEALAAKAREERGQGQPQAKAPTAKSEQPKAASSAAQMPAGRIDGEKPVMSALEVGKPMWALQTAAFKTKSRAELFAKTVADYVKEADLGYQVVVGKGTRDVFWKVFVAPTNVRLEARAARRAFTEAIAAPAYVVRVPPSFARALATKSVS